MTDSPGDTASNSDDDEVLISSRYRSVSLDALRVWTRRKLSQYLNIEGLLTEEDNKPGYKGLAEQIGFSFLEIQNFGRQRDPTTEVLNEWTRRPDLSPTVGQLFYYLRVMGREDVLTDCKRGIILDIEHYVSQDERRKNDVVPLQDETISQSSTPESYDYTDHDTDEYRYMTVQDAESNTLLFYDAFVCYDPEGDDLQFVKKMMSELESARYGLKLFVPWRDDLPGSSRHTVSAKLIQDRCRRMVAIMSPRFLKSPACDFQMKYANSLSPTESKTLPFYDAFVCYDPEGDDLKFVKKMMSELESARYGLKLFVPWRDDLPGSSQHTVSAKLIQDRCRRMVIIMSPRFLKSPACDFQLKYANSLSPSSRSKKLVPVLITPCIMPQIIRHVTLCDFTKRDLVEWCWYRLAEAIKAPLYFEELQINDRISLEDITLSLDKDQYRSRGNSDRQQQQQ